MPLRYLRDKKVTQKPDSNDSLRDGQTHVIALEDWTTHFFMFKKCKFYVWIFKPLLPSFIFSAFHKYSEFDDDDNKHYVEGLC